jgi:hypothetical protein
MLYPSGFTHLIHSCYSLLDEIRQDMEKFALRRGLSRVTSLNRDERALVDMKNRLDEAYRVLTVRSFNVFTSQCNRVHP